MLIHIVVRTKYATSENNYKTCQTIYYTSRFNACKTDSRKAWYILNEILNKSQNTITFPDYFTADANQVSDQFTIVNKFIEYFTNIGPELAK